MIPADFLPGLRRHAWPVVMGVINVTPDSFSALNRHTDLDAVWATAERLAGEGADILDIGGESTRPGAKAVSEAEELARVLPVIEGLRRRVDLPLSIDTSKPAVMRAAVGAGAAMINDVRALRQPGALEAACDATVPICLMHMQSDPERMQRAPVYADVVAEVSNFLADRVAACTARGIPRSRLVIDPGFGFGKELAHNLELLRQLPRLVASGCPVLVGVSRKSMIGLVTGRAVEDRLPGSLALAVYAAMKGASIIRAHDVGPTVDALRMLAAIE